MPRMIAAILRHGDYHQLPDTPSAHQPFPLTELGMQQAREAAAGLREVLDANNWELFPNLDCSRLLRAWQTARIIADELNDRIPGTPELAQFDELAERGVGSAANLSVQQIEQIVREDPRLDPLPQDWKANSHFKLPMQGAESLMEAGKRVADHMNARMEKLRPYADVDTVKLFVGHGAAFRHAAHHLGILDFERIAQLSMYHAKPVFLEYIDGAWRQVAGEWKQRQIPTQNQDFAEEELTEATPV